MIQTSKITQHFTTGELAGQSILESRKTIGDLEGVFRDRAAWERLDPSTLVYRVQAHQPVAEGVEGGLFWGATILEPGSVGDEFFQTRGHLHSRANRAEFYVTVAGLGALILMSPDRVTSVEWMTAGSIHYIPGFTAHRVANIGTEPLRMLACWPSDAGHDYETISRFGFSGRVRRIDGQASLILE